MNDLINIAQALTSNLIFPIFVAVWMLVKDQSEKQKTREALTKLTEAIEKLTNK